MRLLSVPAGTCSGQGREPGALPAALPGCAQPCGPKSLPAQGPTCKDVLSSQHFHQAPFHLGSFHVSRREAAGRILFISDKLRSDHPFRFLQDGNFWKGGGVAAQLEHPLGYSHAGSSTLGSAAEPVKAPMSSPVPCPLQPGGSRALVGREDAPVQQVESCPVSPADMGSQEKFALPGPSPVRGSMAVQSCRALLADGSGSELSRAGPGRASHGSPQCQRRRRVPEAGWEQRVPAKRVGRGWSVSWPATPAPSHPEEPPCAAAPSLSTPLPGILRWPCQDGSRYGKGAAAGARPLRAGRAGALAPSPLKNARFGDDIRSTNRSQSNLG